MKEIRQINIPAKVEKRADGSSGSIYGYAIVYNKASEDMGFVERVKPGAAKNALTRSDIRGLKNHDPSLIFARQGVNLKMTEDKEGLRYEATPIDTANYRETAAEVQAGLLTGQSFGFTILSDEWSDLESDHPQRTITEIGEIFDIGPVTFPAYPDTSVGVRVLKEARDRFNETKKPAEEEEIVRLIINDKEVVFTGEHRFDELSDKINEIRSEQSPMTAGSDDTNSDPMIAKGGIDEIAESGDEAIAVAVNDENVMGKIDELLTRYNR